MKNLIHSLTVAVVLLLTAATTMAGPANPDPVDVTQPDGSKITIRMHGDEFQNWTELDETGYTVVRNHSTGFWEYADQESDGTLRGSGVAAKSKGLNAPAKIPKGLRPPRNKELHNQMNLMLQDIYQQRISGGGVTTLPDGAAAAPGDWVPAPVSGNRKMLLVLVSFANRAIATSTASWNSIVFDSAASSVVKYYKDNSFNTLNITPASHTQPGMPAGIVSVTLVSNHPWYIGNTYNISFANDQAWGNSALSLASAYVDFNALDTNGNSILEPDEVVIYFIVAGYEASASSGLTPSVWAHAWRAGGTGLTAGTKNVQRWSQSGEYYNATTQMTMGVIAHELGHQMGGLPDLYDTSGTNSAMGYFSLMASGSWGGNYIGSGVYETGGTTPTALDAWSREYLGWTTPVIPSAGTVSLPYALSASNTPLKLIRPATSTSEYFLAENRYPTGWDVGLKRQLGSGWAGGMLLTHVDITAGTLGNNDINSYTANSTTPGHQGVVPVQASTASCNMLVGTACRGHATTLFYQGNNSTWGPSTTPNSTYYNGAGTSFELRTISSAAATMTAFLDTNAPTNGVCGSSHIQGFSAVPATNLCLAGSATTVSGIGPWFWSCNGSNGGTTASCMAFSTSQQVGISSFPQNFDSVMTPPELPAGWTSVVSSGSGGSWKTNAGTVHPGGTVAHSPSNLVYFNSWTAAAGAAACLSSTAFSLSGKVGGKASFWMYHDVEYNDADRVDVYVNTTNSLSGASLIGSVLRYTGSAGWYQHTFNIPASFTGSTNYLLINGVSAYGNDIHLDDINVYAFTPRYPLTFTFGGSGYGSVNSAPSGISCVGTSGSACSIVNFDGGASVVLSATPDSSSTYNSAFAGWTTNTTACPGTGTCSVTLSSPVNVTATFNRDRLVKNSATGVSYGSIHDAIDAASSGQAIQVRDNIGMTPFADALTIDEDISLTGGFDLAFGTNGGYTATRGSLTVILRDDHVIRVQRINIQP